MTTAAEAPDKEEASPTSEDEPASAREPKSTDEPEADEKEKEKDDDKVLPRGNPLRRWRGGVTAFIGGFLAFLLMSAIGLPLLALDLPVWGYLGAAILLGGSLGAEVDMLAYLTSRYFGLRCFAQIFGFLFGAVMLAMGVGPLVFGAVYDATHSYAPMLLLAAPVCALAGVFTLFLKPYAERARGGPVSAT